MSSVPVAFSLMASFMSSITLLGVSSENYVYGTQFVVINLAYIVATPIAAYCYLPVFYRLQNTSAYQYLELRFGRATRLAASLAFLLQMILYMGIVVYAPALAFQAVTGLDQVPFIPQFATRQRVCFIERSDVSHRFRVETQHVDLRRNYDSYLHLMTFEPVITQISSIKSFRLKMEILHSILSYHENQIPRMAG